jgi:hypothetical protein
MWSQERHGDIAVCGPLDHRSLRREHRGHKRAKGLVIVDHQRPQRKTPDPSPHLGQQKLDYRRLWARAIPLVGRPLDGLLTQILR